MEPTFAGFGSPVASPGGFMTLRTPNDKIQALEQQIDSMQSPLLFRRTPGVNNTPNIDSGKRFNDWVASTSPYALQRTPPTVSMMSAKADENTPPRLQNTDACAGQCGNSQHFQAWLKATSSTSWTPKRSPCAATPPPAPAPSPACTPMSITAMPESAVSPASAEPRSRPLFDLGPASDSDTEAEEDAATTIGADEVAAAAACMRAALASVAGVGSNVVPSNAGKRVHHSPPRAPAPTPEASRSPAFALGLEQQRQGQLTGDSLATPMSQLSMSRLPGTDSKSRAVRSCSYSSQPERSWPALTPGHSHNQAAPASPVDKVIGLMMQHRGNVHYSHSPTHQHQHTPSRLQPPPSAEQQVIGLMLHDDAAASEPVVAEETMPHCTIADAAIGGVGAEQQEQAAADDDDDGDQFHSEYASSTESDDEIDVAELQQLCGGDAAHGTPIDDIIGMLLTPELKGTSFTPKMASVKEEQPGDGVGPRVLFADD